MFTKWEKKWHDNSIEIATKWSKNIEKEPMRLFVESTILSACTVFNCFNEAVLDSPQITSESFDVAKFKKRLKSVKKHELESMLKIYMIDYILYLDDTEDVQKEISKKISYDEWKKEMLSILLLTKEDTDLYLLLDEKKETYIPTISLLEHVLPKDEAKSETLVLLIEELKNEMYVQHNNNLIRFLSEQK